MMEKVMNNSRQVTGLPVAAEPAAAPLKKAKVPGEDAAFDAQLMQAGAMSQQQQQALQPQAAPVAVPEAKAKEGAPSAGNGQAAAPKGDAGKTLMTAVSSNTVSAMAGLKPWSKEWVFDSSNPMNLPEAAQGRESAKAAPGPEAKRGEADAALTSKLEMFSAMGNDAQLQKTINAGTQAKQAGDAAQAAPLAQAMQGAAAEGASQGAGTDPSMLGPQLAQFAPFGEMGGVIQGSSSQTGSKPVQGKQGTQPKAQLNAALSGDEFLSTLGAAKGGAQALQSGKQGNPFPGKDGESGQGIGGKPNLRVIDGGAKGKAKSQFEEMLGKGVADDLTASRSLGTLAAGAAAGGATQMTGRAPTEVTGHVVSASVTTGANAQDRLSSEALLGVSSGIRNFASQGGGEVRIRLRPENLGELHVRVVTDGKSVGLHIQASDEQAKKILEESIGSLKDSLAAQSLSLGAIDVSVAQAQQGGGASNDRGGDGQQSSHHQGMQDMLGQQGGQFGQSNGRSGREGWNGVGDDSAFGNRVSARGIGGGARASAAAAQAHRTQSTASAGRLDVRG